MDKREIYEHLAKIYLDASNRHKRKKKSKTHLYLYRNLFLVLIFLTLGFSLHLPRIHSQKKNIPVETSLFILESPAKINFNFHPAKKETLTFNLKGLNLKNFKAIAFNVKKTNPQDKIYLRVELANSFKETSEVYLKDISHRWQEFKIELLNFKKITDWSNMQKLSFIIEEWNTTKDQGVVYVDNVRFVK